MKTKEISRPRRGPADPEKGAVLLIAILVSSVALAVGLGVYNRTYKELLFASFWKQTQVAFSAADAGLECALYLGNHTTAPISCFGSPITTWIPGTVGNFNFNASVSGGCVNVNIIKIAGSPGLTTIEARGYNTPYNTISSSCVSDNPRRVERGLKASYEE